MVGHYTIAGAACRLGPPGSALARLLLGNRDRIAISDIEIVAGKPPDSRRRGAFVALADVPDLVWRRTRPKVPPITSPIWISLGEPRLVSER
jgi:hypothetical protein